MAAKTALYRYYDEDDVLLYVGVSWSATARLATGAKPSARSTR